MKWGRVTCAALFIVALVATGCGNHALVTVESDDAGISSSRDGGIPAARDATIADDAGSPLSLSLGAPTIDFGLVGCGTTPASKTLSILNTSSAASGASLTFSASLPSGALFHVVGGSSGLVFPGASGSITLSASTVPTSAVAGAPITSTLTLTTNVPGSETVAVPLTVTPQGGSLAITPATAGFGQVQLANAAPLPLAISNVGNAPVTFTFGAPADADGGAEPTFGVAYAGSPAAITMAPGDVLTDAGATFLPTAPGPLSALAAIVTTDPLCASAPGIAMSGTGTAAEITVGPSPLQFGAVGCGQTGTALQVTITNASPDAVAFTDSLGQGASSPFAIDVTSGTVPGADGDAGAAVITVTPKPIPASASLAPGAYSDTLLVTPSTPFVSPTTIPLSQSAQGAILGVLMSTTGFGPVSEGGKSLGFTVTNSGNLDAPLAVLTAGAGYAAAITSSPATATAHGGVAVGSVTFTPLGNGSTPGTLTVTTTAALCSAPPGAVTLTAIGELPDD